MCECVWALPLSVKQVHSAHCMANVTVRHAFERRKETLKACGFTYTDAMGQALFEELMGEIWKLRKELETNPRVAAKKTTRKATKKTKSKRSK